MTKEELIKDVALAAGITQWSAKVVLERITEVVRTEVVIAGRCRLDDIGVFSLIERAARPGRNPKTGEPIQVPAKVVVKFRPASGFKAQIAGMYL